MKFHPLLTLVLLLAGTEVIAFAAQPSQPPRWVRRDGGTGFERPDSIAVDFSGNVLLGGTFTNSGTFGTNVFPGSGELSGYIAFYDRNGSNRWARPIANATDNRVHMVSFDAAGNVYATGYFSGTMDFGGTNRTSAGSNDLFVAKYDPSGVLKWVFTGGGTDRDEGFVIGVDAATNVYVSVLFRGTSTFGTKVINSAGGQDILALKLNANGALQWVRSGGGTGADEPREGTVDAAGNFYVAGVMSGTATFGSNILVSAGGLDAVVLKYDRDGNLIFGFRGGSSAGDEARGAIADENGNVYITGHYSTGAHFGTNLLTAVGGQDIYTARLDATGNLQWIKTGGSSVDDTGRGITTDGAGGVYVTGIIGQTSTFDDVTLTNAGGGDVPILKYDYAGNLL